MINNRFTYTRFDSLRDIIEENNRLLVVLDRFGITFGFGDRSVEEVCRENNVHTDTFLTVLNFIAGKKWDDCTISLPQLIAYLRRSHAAFLEYYLPTIKKTLLEGINGADTSEISLVILRFFDEYMAEVKEHMEYEESVIFAYAENLLAGNLTDRFTISDFSSSHRHLAGKLTDLKELFIYKFKQKHNELVNAALLNLMTCGNDLIQHCEVENKLLFPEVANLESELRSRHSSTPPDTDQDCPTVAEILTDREKEVLCRIASGLSAKEIADRMCLSVHTVNSYRKSIGAKLNIHSVTGLAVYAILHHIIDIDRIEIS